jgi:hypothetical protein
MGTKLDSPRFGKTKPIWLGSMRGHRFPRFGHVHEQGIRESIDIEVTSYKILAFELPLVRERSRVQSSLAAPFNSFKLLILSETSASSIPPRREKRTQ